MDSELGRNLRATIGSSQQPTDEPKDHGVHPEHNASATNVDSSVWRRRNSEFQADSRSRSAKTDGPVGERIATYA